MEKAESVPVIDSHTAHIHTNILPLTLPWPEALLVSAHGVVEL